MKLELKHLAPYLPYGLKIKGEKPVSEYDLMTLCDRRGLSNITIDTVIDAPAFYKPILRPLSDLTKEIEHNGKKFTPEIELLQLFGDFELNHNPRLLNFTLDKWVSWSDLTKFTGILFEWHFDVFGLIENGLAIDINTLNKKQ